MSEKNNNFGLVGRLPAGVKFFILCIFSIGLFFISDPYLMAAFTLVIAGFYPLADFSPLKILKVLQPLWWVIGLTMIFQIFIVSPPVMFTVVLRLIALILLAALVTLTTPTAQMLETFERIFQPLKFIGINPAKISLTLALTLRFIPVFQRIFNDVRQAQKARGLEKSVIALVIPVAVRMFKMSDDVAAAIEARGYET